MPDPMELTHKLMSAAAYEADGKLILLSQTGSRAYGTDNPDSDWDSRGVYMASLPRVLSMKGAQRSLSMLSPHDSMVYELSHFCKLAAAANPTALEVLWAPNYFGGSRSATMLQGFRREFLSKLIVRTYGGYAVAQLTKARDGTGSSRGEDHYRRTKFKLHTLRLLDAGIAALTTGEVQVRVPDPELLKQQALLDLDQIELLVKEKMGELERAAVRSALPERPDERAINKLIYEMRLS